MEETLSHDRFISLHRNQINPVPMPKSTLTFAYGNLRYGKFNCQFNTLKTIEMLDKNLQSADNVLRTKVLIEVNEDFH